jgi:hypothetical protein
VKDFACSKLGEVRLCRVREGLLIYFIKSTPEDSTQRRRDSSAARSFEAGDTRRDHRACDRSGDKFVVDTCML